MLGLDCKTSASKLDTTVSRGSDLDPIKEDCYPDVLESLLQRFQNHAGLPPDSSETAQVGPFAAIAHDSAGKATPGLDCSSVHGHRHF